MDKQEPITKTAETMKSQAAEEISDELLENVSGGAQPKPKEVCPYCGSPSEHRLNCPMVTGGFDVHL